MRRELPLAQRFVSAAVTYCHSLQVLQQAPGPLSPCVRDTNRLLQTLAAGPEQFVSLNSLRDNPGATRAVSVESCVQSCAHIDANSVSVVQPKRVGRGTGSGSGKTSGRGHKGQKARTGLAHDHVLPCGTSCAALFTERNAVILGLQVGVQN